MPKIELAKVNTPLNSHEFQEQINRNFEKVSEALDKQLQRDYQEGVDNEMSQELNMGGHRIVNIGKAVHPTDAMRKQEFDDMTANIEQWAQEAKESAASAAEDEALAEEHRRVAVSAAQSAQEHNEQVQQLHDELLADAHVPVVAENIEDVKAVAGSIDNVNIAAENLEDIKSVFDIAKRIAYGNIGDIRATFAATAPEGCRFTDGAEIKKEDYPELFEMLEKGGMPYDSIATWTSNVNSKGITGAFGYDKGATTARLPLLTEAFVEATNNTPHRVNEAAMPEHGHKVKTNVNTETYVTGNLTYNPDSAQAFNASPSHYAASATRITAAFSTTANYEGGSAVGGVTGIAVSDKVQPKSIMLRHYVVLTNSRQMILTMRTSVSKKSDLPTSGNINGDIRVVTSEGVAYVWARSSATTWMWSSIGRVGTSGSGVVEWSDIQGDIAQNKDLTQALEKKITNAATGDYSLTLFGSPTNAPNAINIGQQSSATASSISLGKYAASISGGIAIGTEASALGVQVTTEYPIPAHNIAIGSYAKTHQQETGRNSSGNIALGFSAQTKGDMSTAIGYGAYVEADNAIQLGQGINTTEGSLQFRDYALVDASGKIPAERLPSDLGGGFKTLDATQKSQLLQDGTYKGSDVTDGEIFTEDSGKFVEFDKTLNPGSSVEALPSTLPSTMFFDPAQGVFMNCERKGSTYYYRLIKSVDGLNWTPVTEDYPFYDYTPNLLASVDGKLFNRAGGYSLTVSYDGGVTWQNAQGFSFGNNARAGKVAYGNGVYVCKTSNSTDAPIVVSEDGLNWTSYPAPTTSYSVGPVVFNNGVFMYSPGQGASTIYLSTDGKEWEAVSTPVAFDVFDQSYISSNGYFYTTSRTSPSYPIYRSADGRNWEKVADANAYVESLVSDGEKVVAYYSSGSTTALVIQADGSVVTMEGVSNKGTFVYGNGWFVSKSSRFSLNPYYEYSLTDLSYTKEEVDAAIAGVDLTGYVQNLSEKGLTILGTPATSYEAVNIGYSTKAYGASVSLGYMNTAGVSGYSSGSVAIGYANSATNFGTIAIGTQATASGQNAIQLGQGTNSTANTLQIGSYRLLDANGKIPSERLPDGIGGGGSSDLTETAYAGEGICFVTEPVTDYEAVGSGPTVSEDYTATGFSSSNYLSKTLDNVELAKGVVLEAAFSVSSLAQYPILQLRDSSSAIVGRIAMNSSGYVIGAIGSASLTSASTFTAGQKVSVRIVYDTQTLSLYSKVEGGDWTLERSQALAPEASSIAGKVATVANVGIGATAATIYLPECSIVYQGKEIWRAVKGVGKTGIAVDFLDENGKIPVERLPDDIGGSVDLTGYLQNKLSGSDSLGVGTLKKSYTGADSNSLFFGNNITVSSDNSLSIGNTANAGRYGIAIGTSSDCSGANWGVCVGYDSSASLYSTAIGAYSNATAIRAIQLGQGTNSEAGTFKVALSTSQSSTNNYTLLDVNGNIPGERMSLQGTTAPDTTTVGSIGQFYIDTATGTGYLCVGVADGVYTWKQITA